MRLRIALVLTCMAISSVHAKSTTNEDPITLNRVIINVLENSPQLGIGEHEARAAAARIRQTQQDTPLELRVGLENFIGNSDYQGVDRLETTLSVAKVLELGNKARSRGMLAQRQADLLRNEQDSKRLDLVANAAEQFIHVVLDQHRLRIAQDKLTLMRHTHEIVTQRVKAGRSHIAEQRRTAIAVARAEIELEHAQHELLSSRVTLATFWGETQALFGTAEANLFELPHVEPFAQLEALLANNPDLIRFASEARVSQAQTRLAQTRRSSTLELSGGVRYFSDVDDGALVFSASIPFGASSRAQPYVEEMAYLEQREPLRYEQQRLALYRSLFALYQELLHAQTAYETLTLHIIPQAELAAADYEQGYTNGRFSLLELSQAQQTLLEARLESVIAAYNYHSFRIEIERLTGAELRSGVQP